ncbi:leucine-rich repeat-containing protein 15, partial [Biomphalaria pfeifferi]
NEISRFKVDALHSLACLRTLDLSYNELTSKIFNPNTFQEGAHHLQTLNLSGNKLGDLPDHVLGSPFLRSLRVLDLSNASLATISRSSVDDLGELRLLNLSYNSLKEIHNQTFKGLTNLEFLDLRHNQLEVIDRETFGDLVNLKELWLSHNNIREVHVNAFYNDTTLERLHLENNRFDSIPYSAINKLPLLQTLNLKGNPIDTVNRDSQENKVRSLILDNTSLTSLKSYALASFSSLEYLFISHTKLKSIHPKIFGDHPPKLKEVVLESNHIATLASESLPWQQLSTLRLDGNPIECNYSVAWLISSPALKGRLMCSAPPQLAGKELKYLDAEDLQRYISFDNILILILVPASSPFLAICAFLIWKRRRHFTCCGSSVSGQYVSMFTRDASGNGEDAVSVEMKVQFSRLKSVSNEGAKDKRALIKFESLPQREDEEDEI